MMEKIELVKDELFKKSEVLNDLYSSGLLEGATEQLLGSPFGNAFHKPIFLGLVLSRILEEGHAGSSQVDGTSEMPLAENG